ncbi:hypothetical protein HGRIS_005395 [Hohenbuehelia grisea]|uniref:Peptidase M43 pregnancy-associated plasma-A domain-containing protein n=1 Tax=Hohenbuehelia grisea TaxID=104357 RepID=A0ABR3JF22_9AGAR
MFLPTFFVLASAVTTTLAGPVRKADVTFHEWGGCLHDHVMKRVPEVNISAIYPRQEANQIAGGGSKIRVHWNVVSDGSGPEGGDLPDSQIKEQMAVLNNDYAPVGYQFELIKTTRTSNAQFYNLQTGFNGGDTNVERQLKQSIPERDPKLLKIWSVRPASGVSYAYLPMNYQAQPELDGVIFAIQAITSKNTPGHILSHEVGHWAGLKHTFEGGCEEAGGGDEVADTAPHENPMDAAKGGAEFAQCARPVSKCGKGNDPTDNIMNYVNDDCRKRFTDGQIKRMHEQMQQFRGITPGPPMKKNESMPPGTGPSYGGGSQLQVGGNKPVTTTPTTANTNTGNVGGTRPNFPVSPPANRPNVPGSTPVRPASNPSTGGQPPAVANGRPPPGRLAVVSSALAQKSATPDTPKDDGTPIGNKHGTHAKDAKPDDAHKPGTPPGDSHAKKPTPSDSPDAKPATEGDDKHKQPPAGKHDGKDDAAKEDPKSPATKPATPGSPDEKPATEGDDKHKQPPVGEKPTAPKPDEKPALLPVVNPPAKPDAPEQPKPDAPEQPKPDAPGQQPVKPDGPAQLKPETPGQPPAKPDGPAQPPVVPGTPVQPPAKQEPPVQPQVKSEPPVQPPAKPEPPVQPLVNQEEKANVPGIPTQQPPAAKPDGPANPPNVPKPELPVQQPPVVNNVPPANNPPSIPEKPTIPQAPQPPPAPQTPPPTPQPPSVPQTPPSTPRTPPTQPPTPPQPPVVEQPPAPQPPPVQQQPPQGQTPDQNQPMQPPPTVDQGQSMQQPPTQDQTQSMQTPPIQDQGQSMQQPPMQDQGGQSMGQQGGDGMGMGMPVRRRALPRRALYNRMY